MLQLVTPGGDGMIGLVFGWREYMGKVLACQREVHEEMGFTIDAVADRVPSRISLSQCGCYWVVIKVHGRRAEFQQRSSN